MHGAQDGMEPENVRGKWSLPNPNTKPDLVPVRARVVIEPVAGGRELPEELGLENLKPQIGHNIGFRAPISTRSAWAPSRTRHTARDRWRGAENCTKDGPK